MSLGNTFGGITLASKKGDEIIHMINLMGAKGVGRLFLSLLWRGGNKGRIKAEFGGLF